jgi:serine-type D-Ala-D-Ala carboxypeptidase
MHGELTSERLRGTLSGLCPLRAPGIAWSVTGASGGPVASGCLGHAVVDPEPHAVHEGTLFDLASLTKPLVTAALALQASDRGELDLTAPVAGADFTPLQLLRHEAGYPAWRPLYAFTRNRTEAKRWLLDGCPRETPGSKTEYTCLGYILLGFLLEEFLHGPLPGLFAERLAGPLGIGPEDACFSPPASMRERVAATERGPFHEAGMARQYGASLPPIREPSGWGEVNDGNARMLGGAAGNAGLFGTVHAVERLAGAFRPGSPILSERALRLAWSPSPGFRTAGWKAQGFPGWAAGARLPQGAVGHEGYTGTGVWMEPGGGRTYVLLANRVHPVHPGDDFGPARAQFLAAARELS